MAEIAFHQVTADGNPGQVLGTTTLDAGGVTSTPGVAADTIAMLARRFGRTDADIVRLIIERGWSNGQITAVAAE